MKWSAQDGVLLRLLAKLADWRQPTIATAASATPPLARSTRKPLVSVIIPCFNYGHFLPASIESVLAQNDVRVEVIVVDDASTDDSAEIASRFAQTYPEVKLCYRQRGQLGPRHHVQQRVRARHR